MGETSGSPEDAIAAHAAGENISANIPACSPADMFSLLEAAPDAMVVVDDGRIVYVNRLGGALFDYPVDELIGRPVEILLPDSLRAVHAEYREGLEAHPTRRPMGAGLDLRARRCDGTEVAVDISLSPIAVGDRRLTVAAVRDVTEQRRLVERHRAVSEMVSDLAFEFEIFPDGRLEIAWATDSFQRLLGYGPAEVDGVAGWSTGSTSPVLIHRDDMEPVLDTIGQILRGERIELGPLRVITRAGEERWIRVWAHPTESAPEGSVRGIAAAQDVTERVRTRQALETSERRLREAQAVAQVGSWSIDLETRAVEASEELLRIHGIDGPPAPMSADELLSFVHPDDRDRFVDQMIESFESAEPTRLDCRIVRSDGEVRWIESRTNPVVGEGGQVVAFHGTTQDVTGLRLATEALAESEARLREAQSIAHLGHWERDLTTGAIEWSDEIYAIFGVDRETFEPTVDRLVERILPADREFFASTVARSVEAAEPVEYEYRIVRSDGTIRWLATRGEPVVDAAGNVVRFRGISQDVTDHKEAEDRYRIVSELTSDVAYCATVDRNGKVIVEWVTPGTEELTGYTSEEMAFLGGWRQILHPDDVAMYDARTIRVLEGEATTDDFRIVTKTGAQRWITLSARPEVDDDEDLIRMFGAVTDITERKEAERELALSEARLRETQAVGHVGSWTWDLKEDLAEWSPEVLRMFGVAPQDTPRTVSEFLDLVRVDERDGVVTILERAIETGEPFEGDFPIVRPNGEVRWLLARGRARYRRGGRVQALIGSILDITERKEAEERHRAVSDLISDAAYAFRVEDGRAYPEWITDSWGRITGYTDEDPLLLLARWREYVHPDDQHLLIEASERALRGYSDVTEYRLFTKHGETRWIRAYGRPLVDPGTGQVTRIYGAAQDVTAERRVEAALRRAYEREHAAAERLRATDRLKDEFLATASHELRTPLTSIVGFTSALARQHDSLDPDTRSELFGKLERNALDLGSMIERLLDFSRLESGAVDVDLQPIGIEEALAQCLDFHGVDLRHHRIEVDIPLGACVTADRPGLLHVLNNLLSNAAKYSPEGTTIRVSAIHRPGTEGSEADTGAFEIRVTDEGVGLAPDVQDHVFDRFYRGPDRPVGIRGTGIGLAIAASYVELMGGTIGVDSRPGEGASFWIVLPAALASSLAGTRQDERPAV